MPLKRNTGLMALLLCSLALCCKSASAGTSFLSPSQKPQSKGRPPRVSRHAVDEFAQPQESKPFTIDIPFNMGITMNEEEFQEYGVLLQRILQDVLGAAPAE